jgi:methane/ammonia monooxygenase subunit B
VETGGVYNFEMTLAGRRPGKWHIHPILGIHGAGSLLGPGQYVNVKESAAGFTEPVNLTSGSTIDLETVGNGSLTFWAIAWALVGLAWLLYWIVPKPTVTRLPVTSQIPLNTDGMEYGLITKRDHKMMNIIVAVTLGLLAAGWLYQAQAYPAKMPQQVLRFEPPAAAAAAEFITAEVTGAEFNPGTQTVTLNVDVHNTGDKPATLQAFTTSTLTFATAGVSAPVDGREAIVSPQATVAPGEKANLTVTMSDEVWEHERLMPLNESRMQITGLLRFKDSANAENLVTVQSFVRPVRAA